MLVQLVIYDLLRVRFFIFNIKHQGKGRSFQLISLPVKFLRVHFTTYITLLYTRE